jgi:uncharacterized membrane protein
MVPVVPGWVLWNLCLALAPLALAVVLFRPGRTRSGRWWVGVAAFVALLPNAPYVLTDIIHFDDSVRASSSDAHVAFVLVPGYAAFFAVGFGSYVACIVTVERWLRASGWSLPRLLGADLTLHALCAIGVFLGRFFRFNSWDLVARPHDIAGVLRVPEPRSVVVVTAMFLLFGLGTAGVRYGAGIRVRRAAPH